METFILRAETKDNEFRRALVPRDCAKLIKAGHKIIVEDWKESIVPIGEYKAIGCEIQSAGFWKTSDENSIIIGLKELDPSVDRFSHRHIFFAHVFKFQDGHEQIAKKFSDGGGSIIDLEYMLDEKGRRVCAFGYWAGYVGAALAVLLHDKSNRDTVIESFQERKKFSHKDELLNYINSISTFKGSGIVIGACGRSGRGAVDFLSQIGWNTTKWDREETMEGGPFKDILDHDIFVNCVLALNKMPPFLTSECLKEVSKLALISDVSCDPDSDCNVLPIYTKATKIEEPILSLGDTGKGLIAIDNLPSVLPLESSEDFSSQLVEHLLQFDLESGPVGRAYQRYCEFMESLS